MNHEGIMAAASAWLRLSSSSMHRSNMPPTVEQCRADQKLWLAKAEQITPVNGLANVSYQELEDWNSEMRDCASVDPEFSARYAHTNLFIADAIAARLTNFLTRHNLWGQFYAEDSQGKGR